MQAWREMKRTRGRIYTIEKKDNEIEIQDWR